MRKSWVQLYAPFLAIAMVQAMFIAVAPSRGPQSQAVSTFDDGSGGVGGPVDDGQGGVVEGPGAAADGGSVSGGTVTGGGTTSGGTAGGSSGTGGGTTSGGGRTGGTITGGTGGGSAVAADTSHCKGGLQVNLLINNNPPCVAKFTGNNGGATFQGVTDKTIKVLLFEAKPNPQVDAILGRKGLATTEEERKEFYAAAFNFINKKYELYGRKIVPEVFVGDCPTTPPDYPKCNAAAQEAVKKKPALIIWNTSLYASVFDIWAKAGIPSIGGSAFETQFYTKRRPFRYDVAMDGTMSAQHIGEYYCKKMAAKKASHSGTVIHPQVGNRNQVDRKLGIVVPEIEANVSTAKILAGVVKACGGGDSPIFTYESDIERATQQTQDTVTNLIAQKVTTVTCMCDPIAPVFLTQGMSGNQYFPEFLLPGLGLLDYDILGQLYDPQAMSHAFGPSQLPQPVAFNSSDPARVWQAEGKSGHPCGQNGCGLHWAFANAAGIAIQAAGPNLNPANMEKGMLTLPPQGGWEPKRNPTVTLYKYGQNDYTGNSDVREVYWDANAQSAVDGSRGAYVNVNGGKRYQLGEWTRSGLEAIPVAPK